MTPPHGVRVDTLPDQSRLHGYVQAGDFLDCLTGPAQIPPRRAAMIALAAPFWVTLLLRLRNLLVRPFGLRGVEKSDNSIGLFPVVAEDETEIILGFDDSHLDFRIAVFCTAQQVYLATWVHCNNRFGRMYLALIMPFHKLIMRRSIRAVVRQSRA
ncbi:MAG: DUF2867 domain-containing protein [Rhodobacterales bacterium]|nr:DUF2867 domain-containing protein [Rhodobacterales bacterium]